MSPTATPRSTLIETVWPAGPASAIVRTVLLALVGTALLTLSAKVKVPFYPVPMTMQTFVVLVIGAAYGWRLGSLTILAYLAEGALGLPVFADTPEKGIGLAYMMGPTGGYLAGFVAAAAFVGWLAERGWDRSPARLFAAMALGHAVLFCFGVAWLASYLGIEKAWMAGVAPFYLATLLKTALGTAVVLGGWSVAKRRAD